MTKRKTTKASTAEETYSHEDLTALVAKGEPLPPGYAFNPRHRPTIYKVDEDQEAGPGSAPDTSSSGSTGKDQQSTE